LVSFMHNLFFSKVALSGMVSVFIMFF